MASSQAVVLLPHPDISFGLFNPDFSDCTLHIIVNEHKKRKRSTDAEAETGSNAKECECPSDVGSSEAERTKIPASSLLLAGNSLFFRKIFSSGFQESQQKDKVELHLSEDEARSFKDMLHFMYHSRLAPEVSSSLDSLLGLIMLSDRFDAAPCRQACTAALMNILESAKGPAFLPVFYLPETLQMAPSLLPLMRMAQEAVVDHYSPMLRGSLAPSDFLKLPERALLSLLDSEKVKWCSEEEILQGAGAWVEHLYTNVEERLLKWTGLILPRVRWQDLHPQVTRCTLEKVNRMCEELLLKKETPGHDGVTTAISSALAICSDALLGFSKKNAIEHFSMKSANSAEFLVESALKHPRAALKSAEAFIYLHIDPELIAGLGTAGYACSNCGDGGRSTSLRFADRWWILRVSQSPSSSPDKLIWTISISKASYDFDNHYYERDFKQFSFEVALQSVKYYPVYKSFLECISVKNSQDGPLRADIEFDDPLESYMIDGAVRIRLGFWLVTP